MKTCPLNTLTFMNASSFFPLMSPDSGLEAAPSDAQRRFRCATSTPLPCYESPVRLASSQRSSLLPFLAPCFVLLAWRMSWPVFSLPSRRPLPHAHNAACLRRVKASSPNAAWSVQKESVPPINRWGREGLPWLEPDQDSSHPQLHQSR
jgi:hypothetical protein